MKITVRSRLQSRINSVIMVILLISLAALAGWLSTRYQWQSDWTRNGRHTLSEASQKTLEKMDGPIDITAYAREDAGLREIIKKFVSRYQRVKPDINLQFVNPDIVPEEARSLGISVNGELVIRYQNRTQHVQTDSEEEFTNALQRLARDTERWLAFIEGHGERNPLGQANFDFGLWVQQLGNRGFRVQPLELAKVQAIPENTQVLVIASAQVDYLPGEVSIIKDYIDHGGNLLWFTEPGSDLPNLHGLADKLQIKILPGTAIDFAGRLIGLDDPTIVLETTSLYPPHPITTDFTYTTLFPATTAIMTEENSAWDYQPFISTGDHTWLETGKLEGEVGYDEGLDKLGPLDIGISLVRKADSNAEENTAWKSQRIVVIGDGDFLSNTYINNSGNMDLGIRIVDWLGNDDDLISIPARIAPDLQIEFSPVATVIVAFGFLIALPLLLLACGTTIWWRRRKL